MNELPSFRMLPVGDLPTPHNLWKCKHASRFAAMLKDVTDDDHQAVGGEFLAGLTTQDRRRCPYHKGDWAAIAEAGEAILIQVGSSLERGELVTPLVKAARLNRREKRWLKSLFADPIGVASDGSYINGQHRGCALRFSGAERVPVSD